MGEEDVPHECTWCDKQEKLLVKWAETAAGYRWLHNHARLHYKKKHDYLSYPSIIIASITGVGGFAVLTPGGNENIDSDMHTRIIVIQYFFAFLNVLGGVLTSINKFSQSVTLIESHSSMSIQWSKFYRNIDMQLSLEPKHRISASDFVLKSSEEYDRILLGAPDIPGVTIRAFNDRFPDRQNKPDVCNGLSIIACYDDSSSLTSPTQTISKWMSVLTRTARTSRKSVDVSEII